MLSSARHYKRERGVRPNPKQRASRSSDRHFTELAEGLDGQDAVLGCLEDNAEKSIFCVRILEFESEGCRAWWRLVCQDGGINSLRDTTQAVNLPRILTEPVVPED